MDCVNETTWMARMVVLAACPDGCWANCQETGGEVRIDSRYLMISCAKAVEGCIHDIYHCPSCV